MKTSHYALAALAASALALGGTAYAADSSAANTGNGTFPSFAKHMKGRGMHGERGAVEAKLLGITVDEFNTRVQNGENPRDMLKKAGVTEDALRTAMRETMKEKLAQEVAAGTITQAQANERIANMAERDLKRTSLEQAIANKDFAAFQTAASGTPLEGKITSATFPRFVEAHTLMEQGRAIMDELGVHGMDMGGKGGPGMKGHR